METARWIDRLSSAGVERSGPAMQGPRRLQRRRSRSRDCLLLQLGTGASRPSPQVGSCFFGSAVSRTCSTYPHDDDITLYIYHTIISKYGWDYMTRLIANEPQFVRGYLGIAQAVASGKAAVSFVATAGTTLAAKRNGGKIDLAFPAEDRFPIWENRCAIFRGAPHESAARLFQAWLLSREYQQAFAPGFWPTRGDVAPTGGQKPIDQYATSNQFREFHPQY